MQRIAHYSKACLVALREETGIAYDHGTGGVLQIFRTEDELAAALRATKVLQSFNVAHRIVDAADAVAIEPALAKTSVALAGGLHLPADETGDCHLFTTRLAELLRGRGVTFQIDTAIRAIMTEGDAVTGVVTDKGVLQAERYVVALASDAPTLLRPLGIDIPVYPVKGYAVTIDVADGESAPRSSVMDEHSKVMVTRLGNRFARPASPKSPATIAPSTNTGQRAWWMPPAPCFRMPATMAGGDTGPACGR